MILQKLLRLKLIQLVKTKLIFFLPFFLLSCFGPVKELKYQIEDSFDDVDVYVDNPKPLSSEFKNSFDISIINSGSFPDITKRNFKVAKDNETIFYASIYGEVIALDTKKYNFLWSFTHNTQITSGIVFEKGFLFFVDYDGYLISLNSKGIMEWKAFAGEVFSHPLIINDNLILKTSSNDFISFNIIDGSVNWKYQVPKSPLPTRSWGGISHSEGIIYSGVGSGKVVAINLSSGTLVWETTYSSPKGVSEIERSNDTTSDVIIDDFAVYTVSSNGDISAINKSDGSILWKRPLSSFQGLVLNEDNLFITHNSGAIYCINKISQKVLWRNSDLIGRDVSRGFVFKNYLIVSDYEGYVHFININDGLINSRLKVSDTILLPPLTINNEDILFMTSVNGDYSTINVNLSNLIEKSFNEKTIEKDNIADNNDGDDKAQYNEDNDDLLDKLIFWD